MAFADGEEGRRIGFAHAEFMAVVNPFKRRAKRTQPKRLFHPSLEHVRVDDVGVGKDVEPRLPAERLHQLHARGVHADQDAVPRVHDGLARRPGRTMAFHEPVKRLGGDASAFQVVEFRGLAGLFVEPRKIIHAQRLESTNGSIVIDVVKHPAKIEDDRFRERRHVIG